MTKKIKCLDCRSNIITHTICEGGKLYYFCSECYRDFMCAPESNSKLHDYLNMTRSQWKERNIRQAKENRARGIMQWTEEVLKAN